MEEFTLFADPWWVNLFFFVPFLFYFFWKKNLDLPRKLLLITGIFGIAFGFVEAAVVVYLRSATGFLTFKNGMLLNAVNFQNFYQKPSALSGLPASLFAIEIYREIATVIMLASVAILAVGKMRERWAVFFWTFAFWDIFYYAGLWLTIRWPSSLTSPDILFLIPAPWVSQVWFPILISIIFLLLVILKRK
jgi:hypothetical protein